MDTLAIDVAGLAKSYAKTAALRDVSLTVPAGSILAVLGPNGAGKTTLIAILSTLLLPDAGHARVAGFDVRADPHRVRQSISLTGQSAAVDEVLTGKENLVMIGRLLGLGARRARRRADELLDRFDLTAAASKRAKQYSGGMRRRLDLAMGLVAPAQVVFLDEPTTGLDARSRLNLWGAITALTADGTTVLLTTQYLDEADQLADTIAVIDSGHVVAEGTPAELKAAVGQDIVEVRDEADRIVQELPTDGTAAGLAATLPAQMRVTVRSPSLDDVFLSLTDSPESTTNRGVRAA